MRRYGGEDLEAVIRKAQTEDFEGAFALVLELREHFGNDEQIDKEGVRAIFERFLDHQDHYAYVAEAGGDIVGMMSMSVGVSLYEHRPYAVIDELIISSEFRGRGLGKRLLDEAFARAVERGCCEVCLDTKATNEGALRFYRAYGFDREGIMLEKELE